MRRLLAVPLVILVLPASVSAAPAAEDSWGKAGVSLVQYHQDAVDCALQGHYLDISQTEDAKVFVNASRQLDAVTSGGGLAPSVTGSSATGPAANDATDLAARYANTQQHIVNSVRPETRFRSIKKTLVTKAEQCLAGRGYSKFRLTDEQRRQLRKLKFGSDQRRAYLHGLASNPAVLQSQAVVANP